MNEETDYTKKAEKVVSSSVHVRKPGKIASFMRTFINSDTDDIGKYITDDLIKPYTKKLFRDILMDTIEIIFGNGKPASHNGKTPASFISYDRYATNGRNPAPQYSSTAIKDYGTICFESRFDAEEVLNLMKSFIRKYGKVSVARMYDAAGVDEYDFTANDYGWTDLSYADTARTRDGQWVLKLPKPSPLN